MNRKRFLWVSLGASLAVFFWVGFSPGSHGDVPVLRLYERPMALVHSRLTGLSDYQTIELLDYRTIALSNFQPNPTPTPFRNPTATPPTQGGHGHDLFYIYCMPCHGDLGQGLTDEFRLREYPPEDTNCWKSGCHGERPYDNGFKLPHTVPALIGANTLTKFATARNMYDFMRTAMPFSKPGSLSQEQYLQVLTFLLEQNHIVPEGARLEADTLQNIVLRPGATPVPLSQTPTNNLPLLLGGVIIALIVGLALWLRRRRRRLIP